MSTVQSSRLIAEINNLLSHPLGSASHVLSDEVIQRREQLKQLRFQLENAQDPRRIKTLEQKCQLLIYQLDGTLDAIADSLNHPQANSPEAIASSQNTLLDTSSTRDNPNDLSDRVDRVTDLSDRSDRETQPQMPSGAPELPRLITITPSPTPQKPPSENGSTANEIFDRTMLGNDEQVASIQQTVKQAIEQTLAVERALTIAEINGNIKNLVEAQRRAALSQELQELEQQKQILHTEIANLEAQRQEQIQQFTQQLDRHQQEVIARITQQQQSEIEMFAEQQKLYQTEIRNSILALQELVRDRIPNEVDRVIQAIRAEEEKRWQDANASHREFMERVQVQRERFATDLDTRFASTFEELEQNVQAYKDSLARQVEQVKAYEREHEALLATLTDRLAAKVESLPTSMPDSQADNLLLESESEPELLLDEQTNLFEVSEPELFSGEQVEEGSDRVDELFTGDVTGDRDEDVEERDDRADELFASDATSDRDEDGDADAIEDLINESNPFLNEDTRTASDDNSAAIEDLIASLDSLVGTSDTPEQTEPEVTLPEITELADLTAQIEADSDRSNDLLLTTDESVEAPEEIDAIVPTDLTTDITSTDELVELIESTEEIEDRLVPESQVEAEIEPELDLEANPEFNELANQIEAEFGQDLDRIIYYVRPGQEPSMASYDLSANTTKSEREIAANLSPETNYAIANLSESPIPVPSMDDELERLLDAVVAKKSPDEQTSAIAETQELTELPDLLPDLDREEDQLSALADVESLSSELISNDSPTSERVRSEAVTATPGGSLEESELERSDSTLPPEDGIDPSYSIDDTWFLGIDFGTTSLRASLFNATTNKIYPLLFDVSSGHSSEYLPSTGHASPEPLSLDPLQARSIDPPDYEDRRDEDAIANFKRLLKLGLPYHGVSNWQPIVQWTDRERIPLRYFQAMLKQLVLKLQAKAICGKLPELHTILSKRIYAVILGHPTAWSDTYVHNLREAVLVTGIVDRAEQVMVIDQAIAPLFALIHQNKAPQDIALAIDIGAQTTDILLTKAGNGIISRSTIGSLGFDYAGLGINQDIVVQLLYPRCRLLAAPDSDDCDLDRLLMPAPGDPAPGLRAELQKCLMSSLVGRELLNAAEQLKLALSTHLDRDEWGATVCDRPLSVWRRELESQVMQPFIQYLNRELNDLLSSSGVLADEVKLLWKLGGSVALPSLSRWLEQKFPNAAIEHLPPSTVASGLAIAPMYRYLINIGRQQYSDYFLLQEICHLNLQSAITPDQLMQQLQNRGVNSKSCRDRIFTFLQGDLPMGIFPWQEQEQSIFLSDPSLSHDLFAGRLFELDSNGTYQPNLRKFQALKLYLQSILGNMQQSLAEPLVFPEFGRTAIG